MTEQLPHLTPGAARAARTLARCHDKLAAQRARIEARNRPADPNTLATERLFLIGACAVYLVSMAGNIVRTLEL